MHTLRTDHSCIFILITVMDTNSSVRTITQDCLVPTAANLIQEDRSSSRRKGSIVVLICDCYCICTDWFVRKWNKVISAMHLCRISISSKWSLTMGRSSCMGTPTYSLSHGPLLYTLVYTRSSYMPRKDYIQLAERNILHSEVRPSCLQATIASAGPHKSSHTVPHCPRKHTSTRPPKLFLPPTSRMSVLLQAVDEVTQV